MTGMTRHGHQRTAKRTGVGKKASAKVVERARVEGIPREEVSGTLRRYLDRQFHAHDSHWMTIFNGDVYVFASKTGDLITMYPLPGNLKHRKAARPGEAPDMAPVETA
jgi:hypothetical protein